MTNIEVVQEKKKQTESIFLRTVLRKDVYENLKEFAQSFSTGRGDWDFGVAIEILLTSYEESKQHIQSEKIDYILSLLQNKEDKQEEQPQDIEMLGGSKVSRK